MLPPQPLTALIQRPDVMAAFHLLRSRDYDVATAFAERFPTFRFSMSFQYNAQQLSDLFERSFKTVLQTIGIPWIDGGRRRSLVRAAKETHNEATAFFIETLLSAFAEVQALLARQEQQRILVSTLTEQAEIAQKVFGLAEQRYREGITPFLDVLVANDSVQTTQRQLLLEQRRLLEMHGLMLIALGGTVSEKPSAIVDMY